MLAKAFPVNRPVTVFAIILADTSSSCPSEQTNAFILTLIESINKRNKKKNKKKHTNMLETDQNVDTHVRNFFFIIMLQVFLRAASSKDKTFMSRL
jgi:hypothetical protein